MELAAVELVGGAATGRLLHAYFNPGREVDADVVLLTGLTDEFLADKPSFQATAAEIQAFIGGSPLVVFDVNQGVWLVFEEFRRCGIDLGADVPELRDLWILSAELQPGSANDFESVCRRYYVPTEQRGFASSAIMDASIVASLALKMSSERMGQAFAQQDQSERVEIESFEHLIAATKDVSRTCLCRGVPDKDYLLLPSLFRRFGGEDPADVERELMQTFKNQGSGILDRLPANDVEWLTVAQHHGLPTRLLDWSLSPLAAAFFAVESLSASDGSVVLLELGAFKAPDQIDLADLQEIVAFLPVHAARRVTAQSGAFTIHPTAMPLLDPSKLKQLIIPAKLKLTIKERLFKLGVHAGSMFPDLDGLARQLKFLHDF